MNFSLRKWKSSDKSDLIRHANNIKIARYLRNGFTHPYTEETADYFLIHIVAKNPTFPLFAITIDDEAVGGIGIYPQEDIYCKNAELGYWLSEEYWGKGIATNAVKEIINIAWESLEVERIFASVFGSNIGSQKVMEKCGFTLEATLRKTVFKMGEYEDELIYAVRRK